MSTDLRIDPALRGLRGRRAAARARPGPRRGSGRPVAALQERFAGRIGELLARRDELQTQVDAWHREHRGGTVEEYEKFLTDIGYLVPVVEPRVEVSGVDREIAEVPGAQLVVPATVPRYALNAANARWGSLFDALYGTDVLPQDGELAPGYDEHRGAQVIAEADRLLDELFPLAAGSHADVTAYTVRGRRRSRAPRSPTPPSSPVSARARSCCGATACTSS